MPGDSHTYPGYRSKKQWRWAFANGKEFARRWAHETPGPKKKRYRALPARATTGNKGRNYNTRPRRATRSLKKELGNATDFLTAVEKYSPNQPRDDAGRWAGTGGTNSGASASRGASSRTIGGAMRTRIDPDEPLRGPRPVKPKPRPKWIETPGSQVKYRRATPLAPRGPSRVTRILDKILPATRENVFPASRAPESSKGRKGAGVRYRGGITRTTSSFDPYTTHAPRNTRGRNSRDRNVWKSVESAREFLDAVDMINTIE